MSREDDPEQRLNVERRDHRHPILRIVFSAGLVFVAVCASIFVVKITYVPGAPAQLIHLVAWSFGTVILSAMLARLDRLTGSSALPPGVIQTFKVLNLFTIPTLAGWTIRLFFTDSAADSQAYVLRIAIVAGALQIAAKLVQSAVKLFRAKESSNADGDERKPPKENPLAAISATGRVIFVATYAAINLLFLALIVHYRYRTHSFLEQSTWVMIDLWTSVATCWLGAIVVFAISFGSLFGRSKKPRT